MNSEELTNYHEHDHEHLCVHEHDHEHLCVHEVTETSNNTFIHFEPCSDVIDFIWKTMHCWLLGNFIAKKGKSSFIAKDCQFNSKIIIFVVYI